MAPEFVIALLLIGLVGPALGVWLASAMRARKG